MQKSSRRGKSGKAVGAKPRIADKIIRKLRRHAGGKVIDLRAFAAGSAWARELQRTVASHKELAGLHPAHAAYMYVQNQVSILSGQLTQLDEMRWFARFLAEAEDEYMPSGPPWSPLTRSFYTSWALFDVRGGPAEETIGEIVTAVGSAFGMHAELLRLIGLMHESRMGVYICEGNDGDIFVFREMVTDGVIRAVVPSRGPGRKGELWYVRLLPPAFAGTSEWVAFTTPYVLLRPGREWEAYFRRNLPDASVEDRICAYQHHMKYGPSAATGLSLFSRPS